MDGLAFVTLVLFHLLLALIFIISSVFDLLLIIGFWVLIVCLIFKVLLAQWIYVVALLANKCKGMRVGFKKRKIGLMLGDTIIVVMVYLGWIIYLVRFP